MKATRTLGLSFMQGKIQLAEVEHSRKRTVVCLAERESSMDFQKGGSLSPTHPQLSTFVSEVQALLKQHKVASETISFALPPETMFINIIPTESSMKPAEWSSHLAWEMKQYFPDAKPDSYVTDSHRLPLEDGGTQQSFMVTVPKGLVGFLQKVAGGVKRRLAIVDVDQFSTEKTLIANYPEILEHDIVLACLRPTGLDASLIHHGELSDYRSYPYHGSAEPTKVLQSYLKYVKERYRANQPAGLLLHGANIDKKYIEGLRKETGIKQTVALNGVRKIGVDDAVLKPLAKESHRFAAAIGLALRK